MAASSSPYVICDRIDAPSPVPVAVGAIATPMFSCDGPQARAIATRAEMPHASHMYLWVSQTDTRQTRVDDSAIVARNYVCASLQWALDRIRRRSNNRLPLHLYLVLENRIAPFMDIDGDARKLTPQHWQLGEHLARLATEGLDMDLLGLRACCAPTPLEGAAMATLEAVWSAVRNKGGFNALLSDDVPTIARVRISVGIACSDEAHKMSIHVTMRLCGRESGVEILFETGAHVGALVAGMLDSAQDQTALFEIDGKPIVDAAVYSERRAWRTDASAKATKMRNESRRVPFGRVLFGPDASDELVVDADVESLLVGGWSVVRAQSVVAQNAHAIARALPGIRLGSPAIVLRDTSLSVAVTGPSVRVDAHSGGGTWKTRAIGAGPVRPMTTAEEIALSSATRGALSERVDVFPGIVRAVFRRTLACPIKGSPHGSNAVNVTLNRRTGVIVVRCLSAACGIRQEGTIIGYVYEPPAYADHYKLEEDREELRASLCGVHPWEVARRAASIEAKAREEELRTKRRERGLLEAVPSRPYCVRSAASPFASFM